MRLSRTFGERGYNGICVPLQVPAGDLDAVMAGLTASRNVDGVLVTMPHKFTAFAHCATSSERARMLGVVSVIRRNPDRTWHGDCSTGSPSSRHSRTMAPRQTGREHFSSEPEARAARSPSPCLRRGSANSSSMMPNNRGSSLSLACSLVSLIAGPLLGLRIPLVAIWCSTHHLWAWRTTTHSQSTVLFSRRPCSWAT